MADKHSLVDDKCVDRRYRPPLDSLRRVRIEMARLYRAARNGELDSRDASRFTYILDRLAQLLIMEQLESRVAELESQTGRFINHGGNHYEHEATSLPAEAPTDEGQDQPGDAPLAKRH